jgi:hypothetical protein
MSDELTDPGEAVPDEGAWLLPHLQELAPAGIPGAVAARISAALAAEPPLASSSAAAAVTPGPANTDAAVTPGPEVRPTDSPRGLATGGASERARRRWWPAALGVAAAGVVGVVVVSSLQAPDDTRLAGPLGEVVPVASGTDYTPAAMTELIGRNLRSPESLAPAAVSVRQATFTGSEAGIESCLVGVGNPPRQLAMLDLARFRDAPAAVLVFLSDSQDSSADIVVVGPGCSQRQPQVRHRTVAYLQR